jgi:hypothetical protein
VAPKFQILVSAVGQDDRLARGIVLNISGGGLCCYLYGPVLPPLEEVITRLSFHGHAEVLKVLAQVTWSRASLDSGAAHYGLEWIEGADLEGVRQAIPALA